MPVSIQVPVPDDGFPIPVERWDAKHPATLLACNSCGEAREADPDEMCTTEPASYCPKRCGGWMEWAYTEADKCGGCGELGWFDKRLKHCCSRKCMLQAEYAETLVGANDA